MDLIQWDKSALANLMGNTNGNTDWFFGYLNTDQLVPLMDSPTSLAAYQHFAKHCISARLLSMRSINGTTIEKFANIIYSDAGRIFHHRGTLDLAGINTRRIIPTEQYIENVTETNWQLANIPFYANAILASGLRSQNIQTQMTSKFVFEFGDPTTINSISYANATTSISSNRPDFLQIEYKTDVDWITLPDISLNNTITTIQNLAVNLVDVKAIRVGARKTAANTGWLFDVLNFNTTSDKPLLDEEVKSLVMIPIPNAGHITPPIWGSGNVRVFAFDVSELKMNRLTTDRFTELGTITSRLDARAVVL